MRRFSARHPLLLLALLAFLVSGQGRVHGYVWCFGEDGHTRVERAAGGGCGDAGSPCTPAAADDRPSLAAADEHCGPCLDLPAAAETLQGRSRPGHDLAAQLPPPLHPEPAAAPVFVQLLTANLIPDPPPRPDCTLLALRTVVLLN